MAQPSAPTAVMRVGEMVVTVVERNVRVRVRVRVRMHVLLRCECVC